MKVASNHSILWVALGAAVLFIVVDRSSAVATTSPPSSTTPPSTTGPYGQVTVTGGPSGTLDVEEGSNVTLAPITTTLQNTGSSAGVFTITAKLVGADSTYWLVQSAPSGVIVGDFAAIGDSSSGAQVSLQPGQSVAIQWDRTLEDVQPDDDGVYHTVVSVTW